MNRGAGRRSTNRRVLAALLAGALLGTALALLLQATIARTATPLSPARALWQLWLLTFAGGLSGFALSTVRSCRLPTRTRHTTGPAGHPSRAAAHLRRGIRKIRMNFMVFGRNCGPPRFPEW